MSYQSEKFTFDNVSYKYTESREIRSDRQRSAPRRTGVLSADVTCKSCGESWTARTYGRGAIMGGAIGGPIFACPSCNAQEQVPGVL